MSVVFEKTSKCRYMYRIGVNNSLRLEQQTYYELLMYICAQEDQKQIHHLHSTRLRLGVPQQGVYTDIKKERKFTPTCFPTSVARVSHLLDL